MLKDAENVKMYIPFVIVLEYFLNIRFVLYLYRILNNVTVRTSMNSLFDIDHVILEFLSENY